MRKTALGIGAFAGAGAVGSSPAAAQSEEDVLKTAAIYALGGPAAAAVAAYGLVVNSPDNSAVADSLEWQGVVHEYTRTREDNLMLDQTLASLERDIALVENKAREEAIFRIYEQAVDSGSEADATTAAETAINETYATVERAILNSWSVRAARVGSILDMDPDADYQRLNQEYGGYTFLELDYSQDGHDPATGGNYIDFGSTSTATLLDDSSMEYTHGSSNYTTAPNNAKNFDPVQYGDIKSEWDADGGDHWDMIVFTEPDPDNFSSVDEPLDTNYGTITLVNTHTWHNLLQTLYDEHSAMMDEVSSMVDSYFQPAQDGEVDLTELQGPSYLTDTAENAEDFQEATMALRSMGFSIAEQASVLSVQVDGEESEYDGRLARSATDPNALPVGSELDPSDIPGSVYAAINVENEDGERTGEIAEVTNPFTIVEAEGGASEITFKSRELAESDTSSEEIEQIFRENREANEDATENVYDTATGSGGAGGGGGFLPEDQDWGTIALGAGALAIGWGYLTGGDD